VRGTRVDDVRDFREQVEPLLVEDEVRHSVPLGVLATIEHDPGRFAEHHLWLVDDGGAVVACALMTPPFRLLVMGRSAGFDELAATIRADRVPVPGVNGFVPEVDEFAARWSQTTGASTATAMSMRMYSTDAVIPAADAPGRMRPAVESDRPLLAAWGHAFAVETGLARSEGAEEVVRSIEAQIGADPGIVLWVADGSPVALAGGRESSPGVARVGPVYTPPEVRGRGYASALTAALTQRLLDEGRRFCFLFTDLANPTSNSIYQRIGYRPVSDVDLWTFSRHA